MPVSGSAGRCAGKRMGRGEQRNIGDAGLFLVQGHDDVLPVAQL